MRILCSLLLILSLSGCSGCIEEKVVGFPDPVVEICEPVDVPEICDGEDNDCDGQVDEGCLCRVGERRKKWPDEAGPIENVLKNTRLPEGRLNGICERGIQICRQLPEGGSEWGYFDDGPDSIGGTPDDIWVSGGVLGAVLPQTEVCDLQLKDEDCDGQVNEGLKKSCWGRDPQYYTFHSPENSETPCRLGVQFCEDGRWTNCEHEVLPEPEQCDGIDNDCNGLIDDQVEHAGEQCGLTDEGQCQYGRVVCDFETKDLLCEGYENPINESCDGIDNDCDGLVDEDLFIPCETECGSGFETCTWGQYGNCTAQQPVEEICDGLDNDCDDEIDEGLTCACPPEMVGALLPCIGQNVMCGQGFRSCIEQGDELVMTECCLQSSFIPLDDPFACDGGEGIILEEECNNYDDDCDEEVDENLSVACYTGPPGTRNVGLCSDGRMVCDAGKWGNDINGVFLEGACEDQVLPADRELCNNIDDDCDGMVDEGLNAHEKVDMVFVLDQSGSMCPYVEALKQGIQPYIAEFAATEHRFAIVDVPGTPLPGELGGQIPRYRVDFVDALRFNQILINWQCGNYSTEPQYDAVYMAATNELGLSWRDDAFPMQVVMTDETAQSNRMPRLWAVNVVNALSPCQVGDCGNVDQMEVYSIVPEWLHGEWCAPSNIANRCYRLFPGISAEEIRSYLDDIFSEVCR